MKYRLLGRTGVWVSEISLGAILRRQGAPGVPPPRGARAAGGGPARRHGTRRRGQLHRHRRRLRRRRERAAARPGDRAAPAGRRARHQAARARRARAQRPGALPAARHAGPGGQPAPAEDRLHRPLPDPQPRPPDADRGDAERARRRGAPGQGPLHRLFQPRRLADQQGAGHLRAARPGEVRRQSDRTTRWCRATPNATWCPWPRTPG